MEYEYDTIDEVVTLIKNYKVKPLPDSNNVYEIVGAYSYRCGELTGLLQIIKDKLELLL